MTNEQLDALLPCPFCGGVARRRTLGPDEFGNEGGDVIECSTCEASSHVEFGYKENLVSSWNRRTDTALRARAEAAEADAKAARFWEATAKRRIEMMQKYYLRDAKLAIGGDLRALRNRVAMMEAEPMQIVPSSAEETDPDLLREDRDERRRLDREYDDAGQ